MKKVDNLKRKIQPLNITYSNMVVDHAFVVIGDKGKETITLCDGENWISFKLNPKLVNDFRKQIEKCGIIDLSWTV